ncbi:MAG TPA: hypothetical protein VJY31_16495 [Buttiauxella sp.]|nr:hypothetical protein [Buttiauxella sp.]
MKKIFTSGVIISALLLTACTTPSRNYIPEVKQFSIPELNKNTTTYVGEDMVRQGVSSNIDVAHFPSPVGVGSVGTYTVAAGDYSKIGDDSKFEYFSVVESNTGLTIPYRPMINDPAQSLQISKMTKEVCVVSVFGGKRCSDNVPFSKKQINSKQQASFQQTLIYNGKVGNKINISYREFSDGLARPSFSNDVEYDLSDSKTIRYKGAILDVLDANNQSITFQLTKNFNSQ